MLFSDNSSRYSLVSELDNVLLYRHSTYGSHTDRRIVFMNLSISSGFIRSLHSKTPIASLGMTVRCSCRVSLIFLQK